MPILDEFGKPYENIANTKAARETRMAATLKKLRGGWYEKRASKYRKSATRSAIGNVGLLAGGMAATWIGSRIGPVVEDIHAKPYPISHGIGTGISAAGQGTIIGTVAKNMMGLSTLGAAGVGLAYGTYSALKASQNLNLTSAILPINIARRRQGKQKINATSLASGLQDIAQPWNTALIPAGFGAVGGAIAGFTKGGWAGAGIGAAIGGLAGAGIGVSTLASRLKGINEIISSANQRNEGKINGFYNNSRRDNYSSANLVQALHKVRHKRVL